MSQTYSHRKKVQKDFPLFRERLKQLRKKKGLTRHELAEISGLSESSITKWEIGTSLPYPTNERKLTPPSCAGLVTIAHTLGVSIDYFFEEDMDCMTVTHQRIHDLTGLTEQAISKLEEAKSIGGISEETAQIVNVLLTTKSGGEILGAIKRLLYEQFPDQSVTTDENISEEPDTFISSGSTMTAEDRQDMLASKVVRLLSQLKSEIHGE